MRSFTSMLLALQSQAFALFSRRLPVRCPCGTAIHAHYDNGLGVTRRNAVASASAMLLSKATTTLAYAASTDDALLGPLAPLVGTWTGENGLNIVAVPSRKTEPGDTGRFELVVRPYRETLTFAPLPEATRNRGGSIDQYVGALTYEQTALATDNTPEIIHVETGMFFHLDTIVGYDNSKERAARKAPYSVARSANVPHGNAALLMGSHTTQQGGPTFPPISPFPKNVGPKAPKEYFNPYKKPLNLENPTDFLENAVNSSQRTISSTLHLTLDSQNEGTVANIPFLVERAHTTRFQSDFWLETLDDGSHQLQYLEVIDIRFHKSIGGEGLIVWPHITLNTLTKQPER